MPRVLVIYDISSNSDREKLASKLKSFGLERVQKSAFIGRVSSSTLKDIERVAKRFIKTCTDVVHIIPLSTYEYQRMKVLGNPLNSPLEVKTLVI